ncbi:TOPRIM nucleotidyl transferase/hydrolase domain-containing protein [Promicromonospora sp. MEB111]|uniref:TOPRIM nucleotidyl transferase/hydrolase domain-containing protein n=1 Tax=Promicromonospora sp. MEB111 TaxID=3040301 RepID=UPI00254B907D|nr:TOPRIM nucleotidyl transferase/hydrolase domain-containing protein [Promicromonospora sp. MEB111]
MNLAGILAASTSTAVLVEGESDRVAVETLAARLSLPLAGLGVQVVAMGGITNIGHHLVALSGEHPAREHAAGPPDVSPPDTDRTVRVGGLYDAAEERFVIKGLDRVGLRPEVATTPLSEHGFFRCDRDLEDELMQAVGTDGFLALIEAEGELRSFERLRGQPAQRERTTTQQLHRFIGSKGGRKERYGRRLAEALPLDRVPAPLDALLRWAT